MKRSANDPSRHSFNGHTRRALGTELQSGSTQDVGGRRSVHGGEEGKDKKKKTGGEMQHGWGEISPSTESQLKQIYLKLIWETDGWISVCPFMLRSSRRVTFTHSKVHHKGFMSLAIKVA